MSIATPHPTAFVAALALVACGPRVDKDEPKPHPDAGARFASAVCRAIDECGCVQRFTSRAACEAHYTTRFDQLRDTGLELDVQCLDTVLDAQGRDPCGFDWLPASCAMLRGDRHEGQSCVSHHDAWPAFAADCADGLTCSVEGVCVPTSDGPVGPPAQKTEGDACNQDVPISCGPKDFVCNPDGVCQRWALPGEACTNGLCQLTLCNDGSERLYCKGAGPGRTGVCAKTPDIGEPCDPLDWLLCGSCAASGYCDAATKVCVTDEPPSICRTAWFDE